MPPELEDIGFMKAKIENIEKKQDEIYDVVKMLQSDMDEGKGARKTLHWVYLLVATALAFKFGDFSRLFTGGK